MRCYYRPLSARRLSVVDIPSALPTASNGWARALAARSPPVWARRGRPARASTRGDRPSSTGSAHQVSPGTAPGQGCHGVTAVVRPMCACSLCVCPAYSVNRRPGYLPNIPYELGVRARMSQRMGFADRLIIFVFMQFRKVSYSDLYIYQFNLRLHYRKY